MSTYSDNKRPKNTSISGKYPIYSLSRKQNSGNKYNFLKYAFRLPHRALQVQAPHLNTNNKRGWDDLISCLKKDKFEKRKIITKIVDNMDLRFANSFSKVRRGSWHSFAHSGISASHPWKDSQQQHPCKGPFSIGTSLWLWSHSPWTQVIPGDSQELGTYLHREAQISKNRKHRNRHGKKQSGHYAVTKTHKSNYLY